MIGDWIKRALGSETAASVLKQVTYEKNGDDTALGVVGEVNATLVDSTGTEITSLGGGSSGGGDTSYSTEQNDFTASVTNATNNIVLSTDSIGGVSIAENHIMTGILKLYDASTEEVIDVKLDNFTWTAATKTIDTTNCTGAFTFATGDIVSLTLSGADKAYDINQDADKVLVENVTTQTSPEPVVSASDIGATNNTWIDQGSEVDVTYVDDILVYVNFTVNDSTGNYIKILIKYENGGTDEFEQEALAKYQKTIGDASRKVAYPFEVTGVVSIQVQTKATVVGATEGTVTINIVKK